MKSGFHRFFIDMKIRVICFFIRVIRGKLLMPIEPFVFPGEIVPRRKGHCSQDGGGGQRKTRRNPFAELHRRLRFRREFYEFAGVAQELRFEGVQIVRNIVFKELSADQAVVKRSLDLHFPA